MTERFKCVVSYRSSRSKTISTWRTLTRGADVVQAADATVAALKKRLRRPLTVVGIYVHLREE